MNIYRPLRMEFLLDLEDMLLTLILVVSGNFILNIGSILTSAILSSQKYDGGPRGRGTLRVDLLRCRLYQSLVLSSHRLQNHVNLDCTLAPFPIF